MAAWSSDGLSTASSRPTILAAIAEHDNGWREADAAPIVGADGRLLDFVNAPPDVRRGVWPLAVERLAAKPYAAALVAQHAMHVYAGYHDAPEWRPFFEGMSRRRDLHLARAARNESELLSDYFFVRMGDLLSLVFCNGWTDEHEHERYRVRLAGDRLVVSPDPFGGREVPFEVAARRLPDRPFGAQADARQAFESAPVVALKGSAIGR